MKKIVFLDVDGTLIDYRLQMPKSAQTAVETARKNGHIVYICTGCSKAEIEYYHWTLELDGMIGGNGAYVENGDKVLLHRSLTLEQCTDVVNWLKERQLPIILEANSGMYASDDLKSEKGRNAFLAYSKGKGNTDPSNYDWDKRWGKYVWGKSLYRDDVNKISFVMDSYQDHLDSAERFSDLVANTWGGKGEAALFGDLGVKGIDKAYAIEIVLKHHNMTKEDAISFGDAKIDLSMFEACGYNVAMGNGGPEIKEAADYITDDINDDGLYNAFKKLGLI